MRNVRVLIVAPYAGLREMANSVKQNRDDIDIDVVEGNLEQGVIAARKRQGNEYDAIISRGGTALLLRDAMDAPVVEIDFSVYDMLRIMRMMDYMSMKGAIVGFPNIASCAQIVSELLSNNIFVKTIMNASEVGNVLRSLRDEGYNFIIGDQIVHDEAKHLNLNTVLFPSGIEALNKAIDEAVKICDVTKRIQSQADLYRRLLGCASESVFVCTKRGRVLYSDWDSGERVYAAIQSRISQNVAVGADWLEMDDRECWRLREVVLSGDDEDTMAVFGQRFAPPGDDGTIEVKSAADMPEMFFHLCTNGDSQLERLQEDVSVYGKSMLPIMLIGENGCGKTNIAYAMHRGSAKRKQLFVRLVCEKLTKDAFLKESGPDSLLAGKDVGTLYFDGVDQLPEETQQEVYRFLKLSSTVANFRLIFSAEQDVELLAQEAGFHKKLARLLTGLVLAIAPLRERIAGIEGMSAMIMNECNVQYGRQVLGLDSKARELLKSYDWPGNIAQLCRVLSALVLKGPKQLISFDELSSAIKQEEKMRRAQKTQYSIDMNATLEDITRAVVQEALKEENMNQTQTAKRLGISRSTLWRILKTNQ